MTVQFSVTSAGGTPTGDVTVGDGTVSCTATVAAGHCALTFTTAGAKTLTASYAGDANFAASVSAAESHQVNGANTTTTTIISDAPDPSVVGQSVTVQFSVTSAGGTPTGDVTVGDGTVSCTATVAAGHCALTFTTLGAKTLTARYAGDANFAPSVSAGESHQVNPASTTTTITSDAPDPSELGQSVTVQFSVTSAGGTPTGDVTVGDGTVSCTATVAAGHCALTFMTLGAKTLTARYAGDANFAASVSAAESHQVNPASTTTTLVSSPNPSVVNDSVTFTANVSPAPAGGTVAFKEDGAVIAGCGARPLTAGQATCATAALTAQVHRITAAYSGDANHLSSSDALYQGVHARPAVAAGWVHTCGLQADGTLACWGYNDDGRTTVPSNPNWVQVSTGSYHTCGLQADGTLACWGDNWEGQTSVPSNPNWVQVSAGDQHTCGLQADGTLVCWGYNSDGQTDVPGPNANWVQVSAGGLHTCGLQADGTLACWGRNGEGQTTVPSNPDWVQVSAGGLHTCGLKADGTLACWGRNG